jgi:NAD(P)-dependent dehydrogenase (short-subunit alcohol dehydrogenase family)
MDTKRDVAGQVWLITGCSSGLGHALAVSVLERGGNVIATARDAGTLADIKNRWPSNVLLCPLDVTRPDTIASAVAEALAWKGRIDVLVNNAGYGIVGAIEEVDEDEAKAAFDTNFFGVYRMTRAVLPSMRSRGAGHIVNLSSMLGHTSAAGFGLYSAVKFAVEGLSEALAKEVAPFGIGVTIVAPGPFRTAFRGRGLHMALPRAPYDETLRDFRRNLMESDGQQPGDPRRGGDLIIDAVNADAPPLRLILGEPALRQVRAKLASVAADMDQWERASIATAFAP